MTYARNLTFDFNIRFKTISNSILRPKIEKSICALHHSNHFNFVFSKKYNRLIIDGSMSSFDGSFVDFDS